jgi:hypothetical protein
VERFGGNRRTLQVEPPVFCIKTMLFCGARRHTSDREELHLLIISVN